MSIITDMFNTQGKLALTELSSAKLKVLNMSAKTKVKSKKVSIKVSTIHKAHYMELNIDIGGITPYLNEDKSFKSYSELDETMQAQLDADLYTKKVENASLWLDIEIRDQDIKKTLDPKNSTIERNFIRSLAEGLFTAKQVEAVKEIYTNLTK